MDIVVKYNGITITPTPLVQQNFQFLDYGTRYGNVLELQLDGMLSGISSTGSLLNIVNIFSGQFGTLDVLEGSNTIYSWPNLLVDNISFPENHFFTNSIAPYSVKLKKFNLPSGVVDPTNEYSFNQGEEGVVVVNHRMSARGVKGQTGAFENAINFVRLQTGSNPFGPAFMPSGQNVLMSLSESINRAEGVYSVSEVYRYNTGSTVPYVETFKVNINDDINSDYLVLETEMKIQGSPVNNNLGIIESSGVSIFNTYSRIASLGFSTGSLLRNTFNVTRDSGNATVEIKQSFLSGYSASDLTGFLDYTVSFGRELLSPKDTWKLEAEFVAKGPLDYRLQQVSGFKSNNGANWRTYLSGLLVNSPIYTTFATGMVPTHSTVNIIENTGLASWKASFAFVDTINAHSLTPNARYLVDVQPSIWQYDLLPASNIEGHYVIQDLQMMRQGKLTFNVSSDSNAPLLSLPVISGYLTALEAIYLSNANMSSITSENITTGLFDTSYNREWLGYDTVSSGLLNTKVVGSTLSNYIRQGGFKFGY